MAALPVTFNYWFLNYARVLGRMRAVVRNQAIAAILTLALSFLWLPDHGIESIGIAWLISQTLVALIVAKETLPMLLSKDRALHQN